MKPALAALALFMEVGCASLRSYVQPTTPELARSRWRQPSQPQAVQNHATAKTPPAAGRACSTVQHSYDWAAFSDSKSDYDVRAGVGRTKGLALAFNYGGAFTDNPLGVDDPQNVRD